MAKESQQGFDMTPETKTYLDAHFQRLEEKIISITDPIKKTVEDYRGNFKEIYIRIGVIEADIAVVKSSIKDNSDTESRLSNVETEVAILKDNKGSRQTNTGTVLIVIGLILTAALAAIGWLR